MENVIKNEKAMASIATRLNEVRCIESMAEVLASFGYEVKCGDTKEVIGLTAKSKVLEEPVFKMTLSHSADGRLIYNIAQGNIAFECLAQDLVHDFPKVDLRGMVYHQLCRVIDEHNHELDKIIIGSYLIEIHPSVAPEHIRGLFVAVWKDHNGEIIKTSHSITGENFETFLGFNIVDISSKVKNPRVEQFLNANIDLHDLMIDHNAALAIRDMAAVLGNRSYSVIVKESKNLIDVEAIHKQNNKRDLKLSLSYGEQGQFLYGVVQGEVNFEASLEELAKRLKEVKIAGTTYHQLNWVIEQYNRKIVEIVTDDLAKLFAEVQPKPLQLPKVTDRLFAVIWEKTDNVTTRDFFNFDGEDSNSFTGYKITEVEKIEALTPIDAKETDMVDVIVGNNDKKIQPALKEKRCESGTILPIIISHTTDEELTSFLGKLLSFIAKGEIGRSLRLPVQEDGYFDIKLVPENMNHFNDGSSLVIGFKPNGQDIFNVEDFGQVTDYQHLAMLINFFLITKTPDNVVTFDAERMVVRHYVFYKILDQVVKATELEFGKASLSSMDNGYLLKTAYNNYVIQINDELNISVKIEGSVEMQFEGMVLHGNPLNASMRHPVAVQLCQIIQRVESRGEHRTLSDDRYSKPIREGFFQTRDTTLNNLPHRHVPVGNPYITLDEVHYGFHTAMAMVGSTPRVPSLLSRVIAVSILNGALLRLVASGIPSPNIEKIHKISLMITSGLEDAALARLGSPQDYYIFLANIGSQYSLG